MSRVFLYNETIYIPALKTQEAEKDLSSALQSETPEELADLT